MQKYNYGKYIVLSATLRGVKATPVEVEVSVFKGLPSFTIVGMPDSSIQESRERIYSALKSSDYIFPSARIVVNLAPGHIKKSGSGFDLPIAVALLAATGQIPFDGIEKYMLVGELSLDGSLRSVPGILAFALCAKENNCDLLTSNCFDQSVYVEGVEQYYANTLRDFYLKDFSKIKFINKDHSETSNLDFCDICGHDIAKRALQIAACGNHGVMMVGPPGSGKTMLASRLPTILPPLTKDEQMESAVIHSIAGEDVESILDGIRPFRKPHHSASLPGLIGGGNPTRPGEVSLAHNGVLYLDELAEFSNHVLQGVRQPMESGDVTIIRADGAISFPAKFSLIASTNPCPCGYFGDKEHSCKCTPKQISVYQRKIGGPVLDRIDMHLDVSRIDAKSVLKTGSGLSSAKLLEGVLSGIEFRKWRFNTIDKDIADSLKSNKGYMEKLVESCRLENSDFEFFENVASDSNMSGRGIMRVLSVARTISDIENSEVVKHEHLCEALTFRMRENTSMYLEM